MKTFVITEYPSGDKTNEKWELSDCGNFVRLLEINGEIFDGGWHPLRMFNKQFQQTAQEVK